MQMLFRLRQQWLEVGGKAVELEMFLGEALGPTIPRSGPFDQYRESYLEIFCLVWYQTLPKRHRLRI